MIKKIKKMNRNSHEILEIISTKSIIERMSRLETGKIILKISRKRKIASKN